MTRRRVYRLPASRMPRPCVATADSMVRAGSSSNLEPCVVSTDHGEASRADAPGMLTDGPSREAALSITQERRVQVISRRDAK
jgi:hypothetical protein